MAYHDFLNKVRQWDNRSSQWFFRHFYLLFFQIILVVVFLFFFFTTINVINNAPDIDHATLTEKMLENQNVIGLLITFLLILNSFWSLFMLISIFKLRSILKNIDFNLSRRHNDHRYDDKD